MNTVHCYLNRHDANSKASYCIQYIYDIVCLYNHLPVIGFVRVNIAAISHITCKWCVTRPTTWRLAARAHVCVHLHICVHVCMHNYVCHVYVYNHSHNNHIFSIHLLTQPIHYMYTIEWGVSHHLPMQLNASFSFTLYVHHVNGEYSCSLNASITHAL